MTTTVTARHSGDPGVRVRVRVRVIITVILRNGGPPEWRTQIDDDDDDDGD